MEALAETLRAVQSTSVPFEKGTSRSVAARGTLSDVEPQHAAMAGKERGR
jgi:hypothetical protein